MPEQKKSALELQVSPLSLLRMIWKRKLLIAGLAITLGSVAVLIVYRMPAIYSSEALILVDSQKIPEKFVASTVSTNLQDRLAAISQQILSTARLKKIIDDFDLYRAERKTHVQEEIFEMMRKDISIQVEKGWSGNQPGAFRVAYQGKDPVIVAQVANRLAAAYVEENLRVREVQAEGTSEFIDVQLQAAKERLDKLEASVSNYKLKHNGELPQQETSISSTLARLHTELQTNGEQLSREEQSKVMLESALNVAETALAALTRPPADLADPNSRISAEPVRAPRASEQLEQRLAVLKLRYTSAHPDVRALEAQLAQIKATEDSQRVPAGLTSPQAESSTRRVQPDSEQMQQTRQRIAITKTQLSLISKTIEKHKADQERILASMRTYEARLDRLPVREQEMAAVTRDYEIAKANYKSLLDKKIAAEMSTDMEHRQKSERFAVLDPARLPEKPVKPNRPVLGVVGLALSIGIAFACGIGAEFKKGLILGEWEVPAGVPVIGRLPFIDIDTPDRSGDEDVGRFQKLFRRKRARVVFAACAGVSVPALVAAFVLFRDRLGL